MKELMKAILLYVTIIAGVLYICAIDSLYDNGWLLVATLLMALLIYVCKKLLKNKGENKD